MNTRSKYKTKQREMMLGYLEKMPGTHITASDVCAYFQDQGAPISQATVYRQLEQLVDDGIINKYIVDATSPACFEYVGADHHIQGETCYHCKCEKCGKLIHMHCEEMQEMAEHLLKEHSFTLDPKRTILYGLCEECAKLS
jgi:Fur family ferric uptake transcriptional regulator